MTQAEKHSLCCREILDDSAWEQPSERTYFVIHKRKRQDKREIIYIKRRGLINPFPALNHYKRNSKGTLREKRGGGNSMVDDQGLCECGWRQNIIGTRDWCRACSARVWSICQSDRGHTCPKCNEYI